MIYLGLNLKDYDEFPSLTDTSWRSAHEGVFLNSDARILMNELPSEGGLYYLWLKGSGTGIKTVYGQAIIEVGTVTKINKDEKKEENPSSEIDKKDNSEGTGVKKEETPAQTTGKSDPTTATFKTLPNTGLSVALIGSILLVIVGGVALLAKYHKYRDVK